MSILAPGLLHPEQADYQVKAANEGIVALHRCHDRAVSQIAVLHLDWCRVLRRVSHLLQSFAILYRCDGDETRLGVVACSLNCLVILYDHTFNVVAWCVAEQVIGVHVVEGGDHDPGEVRSLVVAVLQKSVHVYRVAELSL